MSPFLDYEAFAAAYAATTRDNVYNSRYERPALRALLSDVAGLAVLDAGCAAGEHALWLEQHGARVTAIDVSDAMLAIARERLSEQSLVVYANLDERLPFEDGAFDLVVSSLTLHYTRDLQATLCEFARVLKPHGMLVFSTHHPMLAQSGERYAETFLIDETWDGFGSEPVRVRWYHRSFQTISQSVIDAGFTIATVCEAKPDASIAEVNERAYRQMLRVPFLLMRATKRS